jgi:hypothetical protein
MNKSQLSNCEPYSYMQQHSGSSFLWSRFLSVVARSLAFCVMFCRLLLVLLFFFIWHCIISSTSMDDFWLPLWCLVAIVWYVIFDVRLLVTPLVSSITQKAKDRATTDRNLLHRKELPECCCI